MQGIKYFIRDFENTNDTRLVDFRRHVNSFIQGGVDPQYAAQLKERVEKHKKQRKRKINSNHDEIEKKKAPEPIKKPECAICFEEIEGQGCYACPNNHFFHCQCINSWFHSNAISHRLCPTCREPICANVAERHEPKMVCAPQQQQQQQQVSQSESEEEEEDIFQDIFEAVDGNNIPRVEQLIEANVSLENERNGQTALHIAAENGFTEIATLLINAKANLNATMNQGVYDFLDVNGTPLYLAAKENNPAMFNLLLNAKADVDYNCEGGCETPLLQILSDDPNSPHAIQMLVDAKANLEIKNDNGYNPLHQAIGPLSNHTQYVQILIDAKSNPNALVGEENFEGFANKPPLELAKYFNNNNIVQALIAAKATVD